MGSDDTESFTAFVHEHGDRLARLAAGLARDRQDAQDLLSESLVNLWRYWSRARAADDLLTYASRTVINTHHRLYRRSSARSGVENRLRAVQPTERHDVDPTGDLVEAARIQAALGALPARERAAAVLRYQFDLSTTEIAAALNCSPGSARVYLSRAYRKLADVIDDEETSHGNQSVPRSSGN